MIKTTSAEANKLIKKLNEEKSMLLSEQNDKSSFIAAVEENIEDVRPEFDLFKNIEQIEEINDKVRKIKHAINVFNTTHHIGDKTIDEVLVLIPMLTQKKHTLTMLARAQKKTRAESNYGRTNTHIEYKYANYDIDKVKAMLSEVTDELLKLQLALDDINRSEVFEIDI